MKEITKLEKTSPSDFKLHTEECQEQAFFTDCLCRRRRHVWKGLIRMESKVLETSKRFWDVMEHADEAGIREIADSACQFVHIGVTAGLDQEIRFYTEGLFRPTEVKMNSQKAALFQDTAVVLTDCNYSLLLDGQETTHHFAVTEVYILRDDKWKLIQFSFTALVY